MEMIRVQNPYKTFASPLIESEC